MVRCKRIYEAIAIDDGYRVLADRLWPRGVSREAADIDLWAKALAPSAALRGWYGHRPERWHEFAVRYRIELDDAEASEQLELLRARARGGTVTLLTATRADFRSHLEALQQRLVGETS